MKKFNNFEKVEEANIIKNVRNRIRNFDKFGSQSRDKQKIVIDLLKKLALNNKGVELVDGGVNISTGGSVYYLGLDGEVKFPYDSTLYLDVDDAKEIYDMITRTPSPPTPTPSNDPSFTEDTPEFEEKIRRMSRKAPKKAPTFPCVYHFMTKELADKKRAKGQKIIGIKSDGYAFFCETPEDLDNYKHVYKSGEKYKGETITGVYVAAPEN